MATTYSPAVEAIWSVFPKTGGKAGNKKDFASKWAKLGLTDEDQERVMTLLSENPPIDGISAGAWLGQVIAGERPRRKPERKHASEDNTPTEQPEESAQKHAGGRPRKTGQVRVTLSVTERTMQALRLIAAMETRTMSEIVDQWAETASENTPALRQILAIKS